MSETNHHPWPWPIDKPEYWQERRALVLGGGKSGLAAARFLQEKGVHVRLSEGRSLDDNQRKKLRSWAISYEEGMHTTSFLSDVDLVVISPGIPLETTPIVQSIIDQGISLIGEFELSMPFLGAPLIAVTGSNGKTTTTTLIAKLLADAGMETACGGNIGTPMVDLISNHPQVFVSEVSSFQLETAPTARPHIGILLNLYDNHLDRHPSRDHYFSLKFNLFRNQSPEDWTILNAESAEIRDRAAQLASQVMWFGIDDPESPSAIFVRDGHVTIRVRGEERMLFPETSRQLKGRHNLENILAASAAAYLMGVSPEQIALTVLVFTGVAHRQEVVAQLEGVTWINDSKATNYEAASKAIESFDQPIILLLGGRDKGGNFAKLASLIQDRVRHVVLFGEAGPAFGEQLKAVGYDACSEPQPDVPAAVEMARAIARSGEVVLFSPATTSYDQFRNYEERGGCFRDAVRRTVSDEA